MDLEVISQKLDSLTRCIDRIRGTCPQSVAELQKDIDAQDILTLNLSRAVQMTVDISTHIIACTRAQTPQTMGESVETVPKKLRISAHRIYPQSVDVQAHPTRPS